MPQCKSNLVPVFLIKWFDYLSYLLSPPPLIFQTVTQTATWKSEKRWDFFSTDDSNEVRLIPSDSLIVNWFQRACRRQTRLWNLLMCYISLVSYLTSQTDNATKNNLTSAHSPSTFPHFPTLQLPTTFTGRQWHPMTLTFLFDDVCHVLILSLGSLSASKQFLCSDMGHLFYRSRQRIGKIATSWICSASAKKEEIWWQISGSVPDTVIYGDITSLGLEKKTFWSMTGWAGAEWDALSVLIMNFAN